MATTQNGSARYTTQQALNSAIWSICDILRRSNCAGALQYVPELTWILFLRILDERETQEATRADALGLSFNPSLQAPYRWRDWAHQQTKDERASHGPNTRAVLQEGTAGDVFVFVNGKLLPHLRGLSATPRQRVISQIMSGVERVRVDTEKNFLDVIDRVDAINLGAVDPTHMFALSQVYEGLLLRMGEKGNDGGQFFTPREVIRAIVQTANPQLGETIYDPCCGTGGFLAQSYEHIHERLGAEVTGDQLEALAQKTFYGREKENLIYPIALANLVLHGIDEPHLWHGNTLTGAGAYVGLYSEAPALFDVVLTNPPFGGKEGDEAQTRFAYKTSATQVLFLQHVIDSLRPGGRGGMVLDEGVLFRTNETAFVKTKMKLLDECDLWCVVSLPSGVFTAAGAGVKTNLLFFTKGQPTERIWYYDLSAVKVGKKSPLTRAHFDEFFALLPTRAESEHSWTVTREQIEQRKYDLKAVNPNARREQDTRTPDELLELIEQQGQEVAEALAALRRGTMDG